MQRKLVFSSASAGPLLIEGRTPNYKTAFGQAFVADSLDLLRSLPDSSINLVLTSPPYALHFKKEYGNASKDSYVAWLLPFIREIKRVLKDDGSFVLNIGGSYNEGKPTRSIYHYKLVVAIVEELGFHLAQECFWYNPAKMPMPAEWVTVRRIRVKDAVEFVWWFSKTEWPKASNRKVLRPYSADMLRLNRKGLEKTTRPGGYVITEGFSATDAGGSIPPNIVDEDTPTDLLRFGNNSANDLYTKRCKEAGIKIHPARFPTALPEFFVKLLTDEGDYVLDPFAGSNTTGMVAEALGRRWLSVDAIEDYVVASRFRFDEVETSTPASTATIRGKESAAGTEAKSSAPKSRARKSSAKSVK